MPSPTIQGGINAALISAELVTIAGLVSIARVPVISNVGGYLAMTSGWSAGEISGSLADAPSK